MNILDKVNRAIESDNLVLRPVLTEGEYQLPLAARGKEIAYYELRELGPAGRRNIGRISKTFLWALSQMHPAKMAQALDVKERGSR